MQRLTVYSHPLRIIWQEAPIGRLLQGATPVYAKNAYFTFVYVVRSGAQRGGGFTVVS